ncbi:MAG: glycosyltransferase family 39 protein [Terriglobales bacterium]
MANPEIDFRRFPLALIFVLLFAAVFLLHIPLLRLPYFWDEAGYYVPAARDLLLSGSLIPHSTPSNAHPPLVMAWLALCWKIAGFSPLVTRTAMLVISAFSLTGLFRLARRVANQEVAIASTVCTMLYPVFFAQSSLAHVDLAAAGLAFWGLSEYVERRLGKAAIWFSLAVLAKETAILAPLALFGWELVSLFLEFWETRRSSGPQRFGVAQRLSAAIQPPTSERALAPAIWKSAALLIPIIPLSLWYAYHYSRTGFIFGNPEFFRYNVQATVQPLRIFLALLLRLWQVFGYFSMYLLTLATILAMWLSPRRDHGEERPRIAPHTQLAFLSVIKVYVVVMAVVGGAVLARYMLPVVPLVIIIGISTLRRRAHLWQGIVAIIALAFVAGLFVNPPYGFSIEDNLAYRDYIVLHQHAENFLQGRYPHARVLTAWPASEELTQPFLGYIPRPMQVVRMEDFTAEQLMSAADLGSKFDVALVFSQKYEPPHPILERWHTWLEWKTRFFGYHRDLPPAAAAQILGGHLVYEEKCRGQWIGIIEMDRIEEARAP